MHICHVNLASGYHGGENQTLQLIKQQIALGYHLTVVANPKSPFAEALKELNCDLVLVKHFSQGHQKKITAKASMIHVHEGKAIYWAYIQSLLHGVPYIVTRRIDNKLKKRWFASLAYGRASSVVGISNEIVRQVKLAYPELTTAKIPDSPVSYAIDEQKIQEIRERFVGKFLVIHAANMLEHKGFDVTIDAARILEQQAPNIQFCLLGDGKEKANLEARAQGLSNLSFEGKQGRMGDWFAAADLQVHPSYSEGLGSVILEGIAAGLPVIATNVGGIPDIISDEQSGILIRSGDSDALAKNVEQIATNQLLRKQLIEGGAEAVRAFDIEQTSLVYEVLYKRLSGN